MKRIVWLLVLILCMQSALAESAPADGLYSIGVSSSAKMFRIVDCILRVEDGRMTAVLTMSGSGYGYLYQGTSAEADSVPIESWTPYFENADGKHRFAIEIPYLDAELPMAAWSIRYEKWYDRTLKFFSNTLTPYVEIAPEGVYSGTLRSNTGLDGQNCILRSSDGEMQVETEGFSMIIPSLDTKIEIEGGWMILDSVRLNPYRVSAEDGRYRIDVQTDSALLRFDECELSVADGEMSALLTVKKNSFDYLYLGSAAEAGKHPDEWIPAVPDADGRYTYEIKADSLDNTIRLAVYSAKKNRWYDREIMFDSQSMKTMN